MVNNKIDFYHNLELLTRKGKFFLLLVSIPAILPPIAVKGFSYLLDLPLFSITVANALYDYKSAYIKWMPVLHGIMLLVLFFLLIFRRRAGRVFAGFVAVNFTLSVITQTMVDTELFGMVILTEIFIWYMVVVLLWIWEAIIQKNDYSFTGGLRPLWLLPLAVFSFWNPDQPWNFSLSFFIHGFSPVAFCMLTPIYITILMFSFPHVNLPLLRVHSFLGLIIGFISLFISLFQEPSAGLYWIILHTPLIGISLFAFKKSLHLQPTH